MDFAWSRGANALGSHEVSLPATVPLFTIDPVQFTDNTSTRRVELNIAWGIPTGIDNVAGIISYQIDYKETGTDDTPTVVDLTSTSGQAVLSQEITALIPGKVYDFRIRARTQYGDDSYGYGPWTTSLVVVEIPMCRGIITLQSGATGDTVFDIRSTSPNQGEVASGSAMILDGDTSYGEWNRVRVDADGEVVRLNKTGGGSIRSLVTDTVNPVFSTISYLPGGVLVVQHH